MITFYTSISKMRRFAMMAICFILGANMLHAQDNPAITIEVVDRNGVAVPGVQVGSQSRDFTAQTDATGVVSCDFVSGDIFTFSHPDYLYREIKLRKATDKTVVVHLVAKDANRKTLDVVYDTVDKDAYLGSASTIYTDQIASNSGTTIIPSLVGRLGGLYVNQYRGIKENLTTANTANDVFMGNRVVILSSAYTDNTQFSLNARGYSPVAIVDGVQRELYSIDPEAVESVSLQKDALSSMMLGMRSSRGVLVITTKKPTPGFQLSFTGKYGIQQPVKLPKPVSAYQWAYMLNEAMSNEDRPMIYTQDDFSAFRDGTSPYTHPDVNWYDQILEPNASTQSYNLNASGGNKVTQFFINLGYMNEEGLFKELPSNSYKTNQNYERYMISSKINVNVTDALKAGVTIMGRIENGTQPGAFTGTILSDIYRTPNSAYPVFNPSEMFPYGGNTSFTTNLMSMATNSGYRTTNTRDGLGALTLEYNMDRFLKGLSAKAAGNVSTQSLTSVNRNKRAPVHQYIPSKTAGGQPTYVEFGKRDNQENGFTSVFAYNQMYGQVSLDYQTEAGKHAIGGAVLADMQQELLNYNLPRRVANIIPKVNYNYDRKYFAEATLSRSYSNQYDPRYRWGTFFALGAGWDISREDFLQDATWLDHLKLRGVYGLTGNGADNAGYFQWRESYSHTGGQGYPLGTEAALGHQLSETGNSLPNPKLSWEKAHKTNIGMDASLLGNRLQFSADWYFDKYFDLLQQRGKNIELIGLSYSNENVGKVNRTGVELELKWNDRMGNLNYSVSANWSRHRSEVVFIDEQFVKEEFNRVTGTQAGSWFGLEADGFYASNAEIAGSPRLQNFTIRPGDIRYKDLNNDGVVDTYDQKVIGNDKPLNIFGAELGLEYKGLEFSVLFQGVYNRDIYLGDAGNEFLLGLQAYGQTYGQIYEHMQNRWTPETAATATFPRLAPGGNVYNTNPNYWRTSFWVRSGNYIRLRNISLGYTLPESVSRNLLGGVRVKFFVEGHNLWTMSACNLVDPEVIDFRNYPLMKGFNAGVNIKF